MNDTGKYIFISDVHLGLRVGNPGQREENLVSVLKNLPDDTKALFLLGDIFDFWFEYRYVVPKGFVRTLGALAELADNGVRIYFFKGNHDIWTFGYLEREIGLRVVKQPFIFEAGGKRFCLGHGDGMADGDKGYKILRSIFHNRILQRFFSNIHPRWAFSLAHSWSSHNRLAKGQRYKFKGVDEPLYHYSAQFETKERIDYFIFGHYHAPGEAVTPCGAGFYILGEWIHGCEYLEYDSFTNVITWKKGRFTSGT